MIGILVFLDVIFLHFSCSVFLRQNLDVKWSLIQKMKFNLKIDEGETTLQEPYSLLFLSSVETFQAMKILYLLQFKISN